MRVERYRRMRPDIETEWGTYTNPYILVEPDEYKFRQPGVPWQARGRHPYRQIPRDVGPLHGFGGILSDPTIKTLLILGGIGLLLYFAFRAGKSSGPKRNPSRRRNRMTKRGKKSLSKTARKRKRDKHGRFV